MELSLYIKDKLVSGKRVAIPIMTHPGIELLGKRVLDAVTNGEIHYHAIRVLNECFPQSAACTTIMDLTVEAEAFGARLSMSPNEVPSVCGRLLTGYADVEALQIPSVESGRMHSVFAGRPPGSRRNRQARAGRLYRSLFSGRSSIRYDGNYDGYLYRARYCSAFTGEMHGIHSPLLSGYQRDRSGRCYYGGTGCRTSFE